ncbi:MAG: radical SAM protein [Planctomycetota bacterium]
MPYELPPMRPPSEAYSVLVRVVRSCPWNKCTFCNAYKGLPFEGKQDLRSPDEVKGDIHTLKALARDRRSLGLFPWIDVYGQDPQTAFLGDSNALLAKTDDMIEILRYLGETFPSLKRVTSYARAKTVVSKEPGELERSKEAGLTRLHLGLESGDDDVLMHVKKGATAKEMIEAGLRVKGAGFELSEYVMPGLGGKAHSEEHAEGTARVLNAVDPQYTRMRPLAVMPGTPLFDAYRSGELELLSPHGVLQEIRTMIEGLDITGRVCFDHNLNPSFLSNGEERPRRIMVLSPDHEGYKFPEEKDSVLELIDYALRIDESQYPDRRPENMQGFQL